MPRARPSAGTARTGRDPSPRRNPARRRRTDATRSISLVWNCDVAEALQITHSLVVPSSDHRPQRTLRDRRRASSAPTRGRRCRARGWRARGRRARRASSAAAVCPSAARCRPSGRRSGRPPTTARHAARTWVRRPAARSSNDDFPAGVDDVVDAVDVGQQFLARGVDVGGGLTDGVHHVRVVLDGGAAGLRPGRAGSPGARPGRPRRCRSTADVMPSGNIVDHGIRYSVSVMPALRCAVPSITSSRPSSGRWGRTRP